MPVSLLVLCTLRSSKNRGPFGGVRAPNWAPVHELSYEIKHFGWGLLQDRILVPILVPAHQKGDATLVEPVVCRSVIGHEVFDDV